MFGTKLAMPALVVAAMVFAGAPVALAINSSMSNGDENHENLVSVQGKVTAFLYDDDHDNDADDINDQNDVDEDDLNEHAEIKSVKNKTFSGPKLCAFVIDNETIIEFGPWWYWMTQKVNITDVVHIGDIVNVTGELEREDGKTVLEAWKIVNLTTGKELTIREEGRPPWAGGPKALGIDPWPPFEEDEN